MNMNNWGLPDSSAISQSSTPQPQTSSLAPLPPAPPRFPSVAELVAEQLQMSSSSAPKSGLFHELLLSHPEALYQDSLEHPDKYEEDLRALLSELVSTRRQPSSEERKRLDAAVLDFMSVNRPKHQSPSPSLPRKMPELRRPSFTEQDEKGLPGAEPDAQMAGQPRAFWWL